MQALAVVLFPILLTLFALAMERFESRLNRVGVREQEVQEFVDQASSAEVATLASDGFPNAFARFARRRRRVDGETAEEVSLLDDHARRAS
ncbi:hypothetical protein GCM10007304_36290 [Rhodococcoides trifolii]|uniref:Uncharacterized protein n=1 Tax=Rhodococcoides trifolii TaxID=908250 RepID=A0A917G2V6_9NOCA|nr:hypothetical protein [Rhodococcus trifolii]GGG19064.1 hypothetical protein GCM10007304_36290 [Rhodococcus trifolii]